MAITTTVDDVICIAPELEGQESRIDKFIPMAKLSVAEPIWLEKATFATSLLTAHMLTMFSRGGVGGDVKRKKIGNAEIEFSMSSNKENNDEELSSTAYGKEFLRLRKSLVITPFVGC